MQLFHRLLIEPVGNLQNGTVGLVGNLLCRYRTALTVPEGLQVHQVVVLTEHIGMALIIGDARMVTAVALGRTHDVVLPYPRTRRTVAHGVAQSLRTAGGGIAQIVVPVALIDPRTFLIVLHRPVGLLLIRHPEVDLGTFGLHRAHHTVFGIEHTDIAAGGDHILVELDVIDMRVTPVHIRLSVVVDEYRRVDIVPMLLLPNEGFA